MSTYSCNYSWLQRDRDRTLGKLATNAYIKLKLHISTQNNFNDTTEYDCRLLPSSICAHSYLQTVYYDKASLPPPLSLTIWHSSLYTELCLPTLCTGRYKFWFILLIPQKHTERVGKGERKREVKPLVLEHE